MYIHICERDDSMSIIHLTQNNPRFEQTHMKQSGRSHSWIIWVQWISLHDNEACGACHCFWHDTTSTILVLESHYRRHGIFLYILWSHRTVRPGFSDSIHDSLRIWPGVLLAPSALGGLQTHQRMQTATVARDGWCLTLPESYSYILIFIASYGLCQLKTFVTSRLEWNSRRSPFLLGWFGT